MNCILHFYDGILTLLLRSWEVLIFGCFVGVCCCCKEPRKVKKLNLQKNENGRGKKIAVRGPSLCLGSINSTFKPSIFLCLGFHHDTAKKLTWSLTTSRKADQPTYVTSQLLLQSLLAVSRSLGCCFVFRIVERGIEVAPYRSN